MQKCPHYEYTHTHKLTCQTGKVKNLPIINFTKDIVHNNHTLLILRVNYEAPMSKI